MRMANTFLARKISSALAMEIFLRFIVILALVDNNVSTNMRKIKMYWLPLVINTLMANYFWTIWHWKVILRHIGNILYSTGWAKTSSLFFDLQIGYSEIWKIPNFLLLWFSPINFLPMGTDFVILSCLVQFLWSFKEDEFKLLFAGIY